MTRTMHTRGYGYDAGAEREAEGRDPQRLARRAPGQREQTGADWVLAVLAVLFMAGGWMLEAARW